MKSSQNIKPHEEIETFAASLDEWTLESGIHGEKRSEAKDKMVYAFAKNSKLLNLSNLNLSSLPSEIAKLKSLKTLEAYSNNLTNLPVNFGELTSLDSLNLSHNKITTLSPEIAGLTSLEHLNLHNNQLTILPSEIGGLKSLCTLCLSKNNLKIVPDELAGIDSLLTLTFDNNQISTLPDKLLEIRNLFVSLNQNLITPEEFNRLDALSFRFEGTLKNDILEEKSSKRKNLPEDERPSKTVKTTGTMTETMIPFGNGKGH